MTVPSLLEEPVRVDEPQAAQEYAAVLTQVVAAGRPVIVRRNGEDLAAVVPLEPLEQVREILAHQEVERLAAEIDWTRAREPPPLSAIVVRRQGRQPRIWNQFGMACWSGDRFTVSGTA